MVKSGLKRPSILTDDSTIDAKLQQIILCSKDFGDTKLAKWRSVDSMMELARQNDFKCRRMKNISLRSLVQKGFQFHKLMCSAIYWVRDNCLDDDVENDDDDDSMDEAPVPTLNLMNRALLKSYSQFGKDAVECASNNVDPMAIEKIAEGTPNPSLLPSSSPAIDLDKSSPPAVLVPVISASTAAVDKRAAKKPKQSYPPPTVRYSDLGGMDRAIEEIRELIEAPIAHPEIYRHLNISPPRGVLLHGPPGCGRQLIDFLTFLKAKLSWLERLLVNSVFHSFSSRHLRLCRECLVNRKRKYEKCLRRPRRSHHAFYFSTKSTQSLPSVKLHSAKWSAALWLSC